MGHKHAALMALYAKDAAETDAPWRRWEVRARIENEPWKPMKDNPTWQVNLEYRRKPRMVKRTIEYPEPCREALKNGQEFYVVGFTIIQHWKWSSCPQDNEWLAQGRIHLTQENAEAHRLALLGGGE